MKGLRTVLDWDGTLTKRDTLHVVAAIGYQRNRHRDLMPWDQIVQAYMSDYRRHRDAYHPARPDRRTRAQESAWLASLKDVELRSVHRVQGAGIFADVTEQEICRAAEDAVRNSEVQLRDGWEDIVSLARHSRDDGAAPSPVSIISVNWSAAFIRACLSSALGDAAPAKGTIDAIPILANRLACEPSGGVPGPAGIRTSADKLDALNALRDGGDCDVLYVGDSPTDFDCLVAADVGVCVRDDPMGSGQAELKESLERVGVEVSRLDWDGWAEYQREVLRGQRGQTKANIIRPVVWWVADLREVAAFAEKYYHLD
ncbi:uncharacterized protein PV07_00272 [Cladophialophora immunda]|uniref:Haloacid dehalogenase-like hydrolase n=1 Tax=Cladophialophora immunda TaxID=569365 RepID=A0A0D2CU39_9EURO|nr:uncharacterized protein PV07_00272 [Cladophialophora immunda]KIW33420.1 hypothetical protein PV07_00272 [Cladophialophora immunda]